MEPERHRVLQEWNDRGRRRRVFVDNLLLSSLAAIADDPARYRFNAVLAGMGVRLHERLDPDSEYRVIYDYDGQTVEILLFISMKQDLESALYRYLLLQ